MEKTILKKCIILANGNPPKKKVISFFRKNSFNTLICADGGANSALQMSLVPDVIIGDLDSISSEALKNFRTESKIIQLKRQNDTDVEKCLKYAIKSGFDKVILMGVTGNRLDHIPSRRATLRYSMFLALGSSGRGGQEQSLSLKCPGPRWMCSSSISTGRTTGASWILRLTGTPIPRLTGWRCGARRIRTPSCALISITAWSTFACLLPSVTYSGMRRCGTSGPSSTAR